MLNARITGTGHCLPDKVLTNFDLEKMMDTSDEWIRQRTGIHERHIASDSESASDLGVVASERALADAGVEATDIDYVLCATMSGDHVFPSTACLIQNRIGAKGAGALDVNAACSGFIYAIELANALIKSGAHKNILVVGVEKISMYVDWTQRETAVLFADGAGAIVMTAEEGEHGMLASLVGSDGSASDILIVPAGGSRQPLTEENIGSANRFISMNGRELYKRAVSTFVDAVEKVLVKAGHTGEEVDLFIPHQANTRIITSAALRVGMPEEKIFINLDKTGNTSAASIPIAIDQAKAAGRIKPGDLVLFAAFGAGLTWAAALIRW